MRYDMSIAAAILDRLLCCFPEFLPSLISSSIPIPEGAVVVLSAHVDATFQIIFQSLSAFGQIKLHAQYCAPRSWAKARAHEVLRIMFGCPEGARKWRILFFAMLLHSNKARMTSVSSKDSGACQWQGRCHSRSRDNVPKSKKEPTIHRSAAWWYC